MHTSCLKFPERFYYLACTQISGRRWGVTFPCKRGGRRWRPKHTVLAAWQHERKLLWAVMRGDFNPTLRKTTPNETPVLRAKWNFLFLSRQANCCCFTSWVTHLYKPLHFNKSGIHPFKHALITYSNLFWFTDTCRHARSQVSLWHLLIVNIDPMC